MSAGAAACTQKTIIRKCQPFCGNVTRRFNIIDTIGFNSAVLRRALGDEDSDGDVIVELVSKLHTHIEEVNLIAVVLSAQNPRLDRSLINMIRIFDAMFSGQFWKQMVVIFSNLHMDPTAKDRRQDEREDKSDEDLANEYLSEIQKWFDTGLTTIPHVFLDAHYKQDNDLEQEIFDRAMDKLYKKLQENPGLQTSEVRKVSAINEELEKQVDKLTLKQKQLDEERKREKEQNEEAEKALEENNKRELEERHQKELGNNCITPPT